MSSTWLLMMSLTSSTAGLAPSRRSVIRHFASSSATTTETRKCPGGSGPLLEDLSAPPVTPHDRMRRAHLDGRRRHCRTCDAFKDAWTMEVNPGRRQAEGRDQVRIVRSSTLYPQALFRHPFAVRQRVKRHILKPSTLN
ncbi:uncharacterized protein LAESUDRAFT_112488 [Laetiporus sulphureus 93-53]|uniref:Secreted protein n=1 Tax=Laetiporus sulphureus 93-53 TaxID=1314785 RepID=A0A165EPG2_9APHY|nr:uncharacterized protein LAESUDRAFT_112488 [Laetiporus sulphureus 93-53]KZT07492.1 hypothetical protein LAESUDRAFT_112488 [Laetiporus sulphureus 93-53]